SLTRQALAIDRDPQQGRQRRQQPSPRRRASLTWVVEIDRPDVPALDRQREPPLRFPSRSAFAFELDAHVFDLQGPCRLVGDSLHLAPHLPPPHHAPCHLAHPPPPPTP